MQDDLNISQNSQTARLVFSHGFAFVLSILDVILSLCFYFFKDVGRCIVTDNFKKVDLYTCKLPIRKRAPFLIYIVQFVLAQIVVTPAPNTLFLWGDLTLS